MSSAASGHQSDTRAGTALSSSSRDDCKIRDFESKQSEKMGQGSTKSRSSKPRWLRNVKSWLSVSEPSLQALKQQRVSTYQRYGIDLKDPHAAAKMHLPIGTVPEGVTTSTAGPTPEKALRERVKQATNKGQFVRHGESPSQSMSSGMSSDVNGTDMSKIAPWA